MSELKEGLERVKDAVHGHLAADGHEDRYAYAVRGAAHLIIYPTRHPEGSQAVGEVRTNHGEFASVLRTCFNYEGEENNVWVSSVDPDKGAIHLRTHPTNRGE